ncbi:hypothetical protein FRX31_006438 [Thalictrum thalictroides]|uniref:DUF4283 domain-containing protein n=1 Tax=Thalictrum thalictroides TaxID=46969 RepID=A0A7J6X2K5_THATH|nr:hypothetical protein FRX31_006438 [Thalictrum thalictroides]
MHTTIHWWLTTVICKTNCLNPNWECLEGRVRELFEGANVKPQREGGALVIIHSEACVQRILSLPPLVTWERYFSFQRWNPETGALNNLLSKKEIWISFLGVPLHLRTKEVVSSLANQCGVVREVEVESPLLSISSGCRAKVHTKDLGSIPRIISLEKRGYDYSAIWVEVDVARVMKEIKAISPVKAWRSSFFDRANPANMVNGPFRPVGNTSRQVVENSNAKSFSETRVAETPMDNSSSNQGPSPNSNRFDIMRALGSEECQGGAINEISTSSGSVGPTANESHISTMSHNGQASRRNKPHTQSEIPDKADTFESLLNCKTTGDLYNWITWNVAPIAGKFGMTTSLGAEGQIQMFSNLARDGVTRDENNGNEGKQIDTEGGEAQIELHRMSIVHIRSLFQLCKLTYHPQWEVKLLYRKGFNKWGLLQRVFITVSLHRNVNSVYLKFSQEICEKLADNEEKSYIHHSSAYAIGLQILGSVKKYYTISGIDCNQKQSSTAKGVNCIYRLQYLHNRCTKLADVSQLPILYPISVVLIIPPTVSALLALQFYIR